MNLGNFEIEWSCPRCKNNSVDNYTIFNFVVCADCGYVYKWDDVLSENELQRLESDMFAFEQETAAKNDEFLEAEDKDRIHALETELATERVANETNAVKVYELGKRVAELETALQELEESVTVQHIGRFGKLQTDCRVCRAVGVARVALDTHEKP